MNASRPVARFRPRLRTHKKAAPRRVRLLCSKGAQASPIRPIRSSNPDQGDSNPSAKIGSPCTVMVTTAASQDCSASHSEYSNVSVPLNNAFGGYSKLPSVSNDNAPEDGAI